MPPRAALLNVVVEFAAGLRSLGPANFLFSDGDALFARGYRRIQSDGAIVPPGLHMLARTCAGASGAGWLSGKAVAGETGRGAGGQHILDDGIQIAVGRRRGDSYCARPTAAKTAAVEPFAARGFRPRTQKRGEPGHGFRNWCQRGGIACEWPVKPTCVRRSRQLVAKGKKSHEFVAVPNNAPATVDLRYHNITRKLCQCTAMLKSPDTPYTDGVAEP